MVSTYTLASVLVAEVGNRTVFQPHGQLCRRSSQFPPSLHTVRTKISLEGLASW